MKRFLLAAVLGVVTTIAVAWGFAAYGRVGSAGQSVLNTPDRSVSFGRSDGWGATHVYWRVTASGGSQWGTVDDLYELPSWSASRSRSGPFGPPEDFPRMAQTFEHGTGWPFRAMRAEFEDIPQGKPRPASGPYVTISGITLPTRRSNVSFQARALPYAVIWPGFLGDAVIFGVYWLALIAGVPAARRVVRAARGRCTVCGYDASGTPAGSVCPECGAAGVDTRALARWWPAVPVIGAVLIGAAAAVPSLAFAESRGYGIQRFKPLWLLRREARGASASAALDEINRRIESKGVRAEDIRVLVGDALAAQADDKRPWLYRWGDLVEAAHGAGILEAGQWETYASQAVRYTLVPRETVRVGDCTPVRLIEEDRVGHGRLLGVEAGAAPPALDGVAGTIEPNADPRFRVPAEAKPVVARMTNSQLYPYDANQRGEGWTIQPPSSVPRQLRAYDMTWPRATHAGTGEVSIELDVKIVENMYGTGPVLPNARPANTTTVVERTVKLRAPVRVMDAGVETVRLVTPDAAAESIAGIRSVDATNATAWAQPPSVQRNGEFLEANGAISFPPCPVNVAFDVVWRRGDREWVVDRFVRSKSARSSPIRPYRGLIDGFEPGPVEIILRPSADAARDDPGIVEIWGKEVVLPTVTIEPPPPLRTR